MKEVQSLNGKIVALNRFMSSVTNKCLPFFRMLKKSFEWTAECQQAFEILKAYLSSSPLLSPSKPREELFLYLTVSPAAVSSALIREENKVEKTYILCEQGTLGCRGKVSADGKARLRFNYSTPQAQAILPIPHNSRPN